MHSNDLKYGYDSQERHKERLERDEKKQYSKC